MMHERTLDGGITLVRFNLPDADQFPYMVPHKVQVYSLEWRLMYTWLAEHVGLKDTAWTWYVSHTFRFKHEPHAMLFSLTWGGS